jgi:hypothetical protein
MSQKHFQELFDYPIEEFSKHLKAPENERILFSGKFGIGKTSFIKNFFSASGQEKNFNYQKYVPIYLFPVNYSVSSNEDIFRYIKYDIIIELIKMNIAVEEIALHFIDTLPSYARKNALKIAGSFLFLIPKIGKDLSDIYKNLEKLRSEFLEYHKKLTETKGDILVNYLEAWN